MRYLSVCSGIEAATVAWHPLGWTPAAFSEIEPFPRAVLQHHYPEVPLHGDFTTIEGHEYGPIDLLVGGTPCQSFSVAGLRGGLDDDRGNLALEYLRLADRARPRWLVWENVPGVLSSNDGRDFGAILGGMVELGYGVAYRVLDAQFFRVAQRRRRVFVVGYAGDWRRAAAVLFERHSLSGHPAPSREAGKRTSPTLSARPSGGGGLGTDHDLDGGLIAKCLSASHTASGRQDPSAETFVVAPPLTHNPYGDHESREGLLVAHTLRAGGFDAGEDGTGRGTPIVPIMTLAIRGRDGQPDIEWREDGTANAILTPNGGRAGIGVGAVAFNITPSNSNKDYNARASDRAQALTSGGNRPSARGGDLIAFGSKDHGADAMSDLAPTLRAGAHSASHANAGVPPAIAGTVRSHTRPGSNEVGSVVATSAVRRLTPRECERLQGFPDDYTAIPFRGKPAADGPRYKALGNSMAVPCMAWIGQRIAMVEALSALEERVG